jgi:lipopolysaccharide export system protein LptC
MDTRLLYSIALVFVTVVGGFYYFSGKSKKLDHNTNQNVNSTATNLLVTQTREDGQLYAKATALNLSQSMQDGRAEINRLQGELFKEGQVSTRFHAQKAIASNDYQDMELLEDVQIDQVSEQKVPKLSLTTDYLHGNTKTNQIETHRPVQVHSPQAQFSSQGLKGNLNLGQYEFFTIRGTYAPAAR